MTYVVKVLGLRPSVSNFVILLLAVFILPVMGQPASGPDGTDIPAIKLEPFVMTHFFAVDAKLVDGKVRYAKVTTLAPGLRKLGLRLGDQLTSIGGITVEGMEPSEFERAISSPAPGEKKDFVFSRKHSFLSRKLSMISVYIKNSAQPNTAADQTTISAGPGEEEKRLP